MKSNRKYHYDEQNGIFVLEDEISVNWLLSQILNCKGLQISKISNEQLQIFLNTLSNSDLMMPNGQHSLFWLRQQIKEKIELAESKLGEAWHKTVIRYRYIISCIDVLLSSKKIKYVALNNTNQLVKNNNKDINNMQAYFEPKE